MQKERIKRLRTSGLIPQYLEAIGYPLRSVSTGYRGSCPSCGGSDLATKFSVHSGNSYFNCFGCEAKGDIFSLVQLVEGCGFRSALETVENLVAGQELQPAFHVPEARTYDPEPAKAFWEQPGLSYHPYLAERRLAPEVVCRLVDDGLLKVTDRAACVPLRTAGEVVNVVKRFYQGTPKVKGWKGCTVKAPMRGPEAPGEDLILVEGVFDFLTASAWAIDKDVSVWGAHGCSVLPTLVQQLPDNVRRVTIVSHPDRPGRDHSIQAMASCELANRNCKLVKLQVGDLNDQLVAKISLDQLLAND